MVSIINKFAPHRKGYARIVDAATGSQNIHCLLSSRAFAGVVGPVRAFKLALCLEVEGGARVDREVRGKLFADGFVFGLRGPCAVVVFIRHHAIKSASLALALDVSGIAKPDCLSQSGDRRFQLLGRRFQLLGRRFQAYLPAGGNFRQLLGLVDVAHVLVITLMRHAANRE